MSKTRLIETDKFESEFLSRLAERESWRKEIHRPIYHTHKWWAKRLGSVFRGILLGSILPAKESLQENFYSLHNFSGWTVFDPFMGSGTTIGEAHKLGLTVFGRDINPVAVESVRVALGPMDYAKLCSEFHKLSESVGEKIRGLYRSIDSHGNPCDVLYYFWVMQAVCPLCLTLVDLFPTWVIAQNAYPARKPTVKLLCPACGNIFSGIYGTKKAECPSCALHFLPETGNSKGANAKCPSCDAPFAIITAISKTEERPKVRLYAKLVLTEFGKKEYLPANELDLAEYQQCTKMLEREISNGSILLPELGLESGYNTKQAMGYGFKAWKDFFNDRQLLGLGWLSKAIAAISDKDTRDTLLMLFSGVLEFNNMFASYKGEGTGAVRHMFAHHILKPERTPIEANIWGTPKSSGSFSNLFRSRLLRAIKYRLKPSEVSEKPNTPSVVCSEPFDGKIEPAWPSRNGFKPRCIYLSCGDSAYSKLPDNGIDLVITDPPFFDNVHYSELADFFYAWQQLMPRGFIEKRASTRSPFEVQDSDSIRFAGKLESVFRECYRVLKDDGLLVFTYHHSREEGWTSVANAILKSGFIVVNSHPVKSEMSVAAPKSQANEPIQLDIILVCRKKMGRTPLKNSRTTAVERAKLKIHRLKSSGFLLSKNDLRIVVYGQLLTVTRKTADVETIPALVEDALPGLDDIPMEQLKKRSRLSENLLKTETKTSMLFADN